MIITITDDHGRQITFQISDSSVKISSSYSELKISRDDARQLRRLLEYLG